MKFLNKKSGFTLIELLVVVAIIGVLSSVVLASLNSARAKGRDAKRLSDLNQIRNILEMYYDNNGSYPVSLGGGKWSGVNADHCGVNGTTSGTNAYIPGLQPTYISTLPVDPKPGGCRGYLYKSDGKDYIFLIYKTVEGNVPVSLKYPQDAESYAIYSPGGLSL